MTQWTEQAILFGKAVIVQFHLRNEEESEDDGQTITNLKIVIHGTVSTAPAQQTTGTTDPPRQRP